MIQFDEHILIMGWSHQLEKVSLPNRIPSFSDFDEKHPPKTNMTMEKKQFVDVSLIKITTATNAICPVESLLGLGMCLVKPETTFNSGLIFVNHFK